MIKQEKGGDDSVFIKWWLLFFSEKMKKPGFPWPVQENRFNKQDKTQDTETTDQDLL